MSKSKKKELRTSVSKNRAIKIFEALGFRTAGKWDAIRLQKKLANLSVLADGADLDRKNRKVVNEILRVQKKGKKVAVIDVENAAADKRLEREVKAAQKSAAAKTKEKKARRAKKEKSAAKKKSKKKAAAKKTAKRVAEKVDLDKFGSRKGSAASKINAALSKKPKKMSQLVKEARVSGTYYEHLNKLIEDRVVKKSDKGYALA